MKLVPSIFSLKTRHGRLNTVGVIVALIAGVSLLSYGFIGHYVRYLADDYCTTAIMHQTGFWPTQLYWYDSWTGRYSFTFVVSVVELFGMKAAQVLPAILVAASAGTTGWAFYNLREPRHHSWPTAIWAIAAALSTTLALLSLTPNLIQSFYWETGSLTYFAPLIVFTMVIGCILKAPHSKQPRALAILAGLLGFIAAGFSESFSLILVGMLGYATILCAVLYPQRQRLITAASATAGSIIGLIVVVIAPGNAIRFTYFPDHQPPLTTLYASIEASAAFAHSLLTSPLLAAMLLGLIGISSIYAVILRDGITPEKWWKPASQLIIAPLMAFIVMVVSYYPAYYGYSTKTVLPNRILIIPAFGVILAAIYIGLCAGSLYQRQILRSQVWLAALALITAGIVIAGSYGTVRHITSAKLLLKQYAQNWTAVHNELTHASSPNAVIAYLPSIGGSAELQPDPTNWYNGCIADYYGLKSVIVGPSDR